MSKSCGDTVPKLEAELDKLPLKSNDVRTAGLEKAVEAPPSKIGRSSRSTSVGDDELLDSGLEERV